MATQQSFVDYVAEQSRLEQRLSFKKMFGEYAVYLDGKVVAFACDNSLFIKPSAETARLTAELPQRPPYPGAKDYPVADQLLDEPDELRALLLATERAMPAPKLKSAAKSKARPEAHSEAKTNAKAASKALPKTNAASKVGAAAKATTKIKAAAKAGAASKTTSASKAAAMRKSGVPAAAAAKAGSKTIPKAKTALKANAAPKAEAASRLKAAARKRAVK